MKSPLEYDATITIRSLYSRNYINCLVIGQTSNDVLTKYIGKNSNIDGVQVNFDLLIAAGFKKLLLHEEELQGLTTMDIVNFKLDSREDKTYSEEISTIMKPGRNLNEYFENNDKKSEKYSKKTIFTSS
jgi:hypothetical protein